ncbi:hypothetical protein CASFOL_011381 [Castilleja foliolosa]|uniref:Uncharacterized protein n=1 Tax=Castilleja foliolosa TaxID=1961234 RepID=A0ABD3DWQ4_9LAMI
MEAKIKTELVFIPSPGRGHLLAALEMAKLLVERDQRLSITVLVIQPFNDPKSTAHSYNSNSDSRIRFVDLPKVIEPQSNPTASFLSVHTQFINSHKNHVKNEVTKIIHSLDSNTSKFRGFVVDMFCTGMIDVANEFNVPTYVFFTSGAATLGLILHFQGLLDYQNQDLTVYCWSKLNGLELNTLLEELKLHQMQELIKELSVRNLLSS